MLRVVVSQRGFLFNVVLVHVRPMSGISKIDAFYYDLFSDVAVLSTQLLRLSQASNSKSVYSLAPHSHRLDFLGIAA
jgi:hypothetical protein